MNHSWIPSTLEICILSIALTWAHRMFLEGQAYDVYMWSLAHMCVTMQTGWKVCWGQCSACHHPWHSQGSRRTPCGRARHQTPSLLSCAGWLRWSAMKKVQLEWKSLLCTCSLMTCLSLHSHNSRLWKVASGRWHQFYSVWRSCWQDVTKVVQKGSPVAVSHPSSKWWKQHEPKVWSAMNQLCWCNVMDAYNEGTGALSAKWGATSVARLTTCSRTAELQTRETAMGGGLLVDSSPSGMLVVEGQLEGHTWRVLVNTGWFVHIGPKAMASWSMCTVVLSWVCVFVQSINSVFADVHSFIYFLCFDGIHTIDESHTHAINSAFYCAVHRKAFSHLMMPSTVVL